MKVHIAIIVLNSIELLDIQRIRLTPTIPNPIPHDTFKGESTFYGGSFSFCLMVLAYF